MEKSTREINKNTEKISRKIIKFENFPNCSELLEFGNTNTRSNSKIFLKIIF